MAKKAKKQQEVSDQVEEQIVETTEEVVEEVAEELVEELVEEVTEELVEELVEEVVEEVVEKQKNSKATNTYKVERIVQKQPRGYRLLLEDGRTVKVRKDQFKKGQKTVTL